MQFIDLKAQYQHIEQEVQRRMQQVFAHGQYIMGPEIAELEAILADFVGVKHCVTVASGTDALLEALMALGVSAGDEVITTPFTFVATATMIRMLHANPVFVDIDPKTYNLDPAGLEAAINERTKAIVPVNLYGQCADYQAIDEIASRHGLHVIEDAAQSFGAQADDKWSCSFGDIAVTSFFPAKPLGCYGDGGACFTDDDTLAEKLRMIRNHGQEARYHHTMLGLNSRFDTLQAAVLLAKFSTFKEEIALRAEVAQRYRDLLKDHIESPYTAPGNHHVYAQYTVQVQDRPKVQAHLAERGIPTAVHYPVPLHQQPIFKDENLQVGRLVNAECAAQQVLSLPFHPYLQATDQQAICEALIEVIQTQTEEC